MISNYCLKVIHIENKSKNKTIQYLCFILDMSPLCALISFESPRSRLLSCNQLARPNHIIPTTHQTIYILSTLLYGIKPYKSIALCDQSLSKSLHSLIELTGVLGHSVLHLGLHVEGSDDDVSFGHGDAGSSFFLCEGECTFLRQNRFYSGSYLARQYFWLQSLMPAGCLGLPCWATASRRISPSLTTMGFLTLGSFSSSISKLQTGKVWMGRLVAQMAPFLATRQAVSATPPAVMQSTYCLQISVMDMLSLQISHQTALLPTHTQLSYNIVLYGYIAETNQWDCYPTCNTIWGSQWAHCLWVKLEFNLIFIIYSRPHMKYLAAYALLALSGKNNINANDLKAVLNSVQARITDEELNRVIEALKGKSLHQLIAEGSKKVGASGPAAPAAGKGKEEKKQAPKKQQPKKKEEPKKKQEPKVEQADEDLGDLFG